ncbi:hypothetical protein Tco_1103830 [Tanacetum coccineum]
MDEDILPIDEEVKSPPPNTDKRESSHAQDMMNQILTTLALNSRNTTTFCHSLKDNCTERANFLKALNGVTETLKVVHEAVKDDPALNKKSSVESLQATAISQDQHLSAWVRSSTSMAWNLGPRLTAIEISQAKIRTEISSLKSDTSKMKLIMTEIY